MRKSILILSALLLLTGCDIQKEVAKKEKQTTQAEDWEQQEKRPSAPVLYDASLFKGARDTTIVVVNSEGSKIRVQLDDKGQVREAECLPALIDLVTKMSKQFEQSEKEKEKTESFKLDTTFILCLFGGLVLIICFVFLIMWRSLTKNISSFTAVLDKISNK